MTEILLFHSALGLRPDIHAFADDLRAAGHTVHVPDFYDGQVFDQLADGVAYRDSLGITEIARRAATIADDLPPGIVYAGFSLGSGPAQMLAQTRPGARGALLFHGALPAAAFESPWPATVPLEVHTMDRDEWVDLAIARGLVNEAKDGALHLYPGTGHLFADPDLPDHDATASATMRERVLRFLARV